MRNTFLKPGCYLFIAILCGFTQAVRAFDAQPYIDLSSGMLMTLEGNRIIEMNAQRWQDAAFQAQTAEPESSGSMNSSAPTTSDTVFQGNASAVIPDKLAAIFPLAAQGEAEKVFRQLLADYAKVEQQFGLEGNDVAGAVAAFLAGSWMAYRNQDFPDKNFVPLVNQVRQILRGNSEFAKASNGQKQELYEQMAILGMFMAATQMALKESPNAKTAANMKRAAEEYLEQFLKTDAERVQITARGLLIK